MIDGPSITIPPRIYNVTPPTPRPRDFARALGRALHHPSIMPSPVCLRLALGSEMADEMLLAGNASFPNRQSRRFEFTIRTWTKH